MGAILDSSSFAHVNDLPDCGSDLVDAPSATSPSPSAHSIGRVFALHALASMDQTMVDAKQNDPLICPFDAMTECHQI